MIFFDRTKTGRLKLPKTFKKVTDLAGWGKTHNWCGQPLAKIGDYVISGNGISAGTVGRVKSLNNFNMHIGYDRWVGDVETLDGKINNAWTEWMTVINYNAIQEVKDFYIQDGRPERIKVDW